MTLIVAEVLGEARMFDYELRCWRVNRHIPTPEPKPQGGISRPKSDGSGVFWDAIDRRSGVRLWRIEMRNQAQAIEEKARLCRIAGGKPGWVYLQLRPG
jgi:hypothetical protein